MSNRGTIGALSLSRRIIDGAPFDLIIVRVRENVNVNTLITFSVRSSLARRFARRPLIIIINNYNNCLFSREFLYKLFLHIFLYRVS